VTWTAGRLVRATLRSSKGGVLSVRVQGATDVRKISVAPGAAYDLRP